MKLTALIALKYPTANCAFSAYRGPFVFTTALNVASVRRTEPEQRTRSTIDKELSSLGLNESINISEIHSILDDGNGHINSDLARSIWDWENTHFQSSNNDPYPAKRLKYSTRDGLRMIDQVAKNMEAGERYADLVQEGVVALMGCTVVWDDARSDAPGVHTKLDKNMSFEEFARKKVEEAMMNAMNENRASGKSNKDINVNFDVLKKSEHEIAETMNSVQQMSPEAKVSSVQLVENLNEALNDVNPTPDEIALSETIRNDISEFLTRYLTEMELKIIRLRFGIDTKLMLGGSPMGMTNSEIAKLMKMTEDKVIAIQTEALEKLRNNFQNDHIGAYIDDDFAEEVSL